MATIKNLKAIDIANYFIYLSNKENKPITNKKLQKLVFYAQAWSLVLNNKKLFNETIEAWVHGPAIRILYGKYKEFGFNPIQEEINDDVISCISRETKKFLNDVWRVYGNLDPEYLEMLTHSERPWQKAREGLQSCESSTNEITPKEMKKYYLDKLKKAKNK